MNRQHRKPRAIAIAKAQEAETAAFQKLAILCVALAALTFALVG